ncbi:MAG TPA: competence protein ComFB [Ruminococcaceae bacterium]|jgi:competence protein ComFB|nr:late competence development ComFB family protein [Oscillospiraceae bacterium]HCA71389.1 competence protein ComFB [Oscillospiraceae bacterium]HCC01562.1 competence protein ComFB [Oscillospiraceae bacterium]HCM24770.1 competence protein ComFB [Oscillospiraceae bacterium]
MWEYKNIMEDMVEEIYEKNKENLACCDCPRCHCDIIAYALNHLPPHYVVSQAGALYAKTYLMNKQHEMDITAALAKGSLLVKNHPHH